MIGTVSIAEVSADTPPLLSREDMANMKLRLDFESGKVDVGVSGSRGLPMMYSKGGHVLLSLLEFPSVFLPPEEFVDTNKGPIRQRALHKGSRKRVRRMALGVAAVLREADPQGKKGCLLEIFTQSAELSRVARAAGWRVLEPLSLENGCDLLTREGQMMAWRTIRRERPDVISVHSLAKLGRFCTMHIGIAKGIANA